MTIDNIPRLMQRCLEFNAFDIDIVSNSLKLPWLKLNLQFTNNLDLEYINSLASMNQGWRDQWGTQFKDTDYQVKEWNGNFIFGPTDMNKFLKIVGKEPHWIKNKFDEDCQCKFFRNSAKFDWLVNKDDPIRKWISALIPDQDLNIVNTYVLPPGGYVYPHRDYSYYDSGLAKLYIPIQWENGSVFGMYGVGNIPLTSGTVFLINNYTLPHWVYNGSDQSRVVVSIGANLKSPKLTDLIKQSFNRTFGII